MLVDPERVAALALVALVVVVVPGPSVLFVVSRGVSLGRSAALATVVGNTIGLLVQVLAVAVGLGPLLERSITALTVIKLLGAAYLVFLGVQAIRHRRDLVAGIGAGQSAVSLRRIVRQGCVVGVSNPKGFLLFAAVLPQFVDPAGGPVPLQLLVLGGCCAALALVCDSTWAVLSGAARDWLARSPRRLSAVGGAAGVVMVGLGVQLAGSGHRE